MPDLMIGLCSAVFFDIVNFHRWCFNDMYNNLNILHYVKKRDLKELEEKL